MTTFYASLEQGKGSDSYWNKLPNRMDIRHDKRQRSQG
jgi:hypothetical protein